METPPLLKHLSYESRNLGIDAFEIKSEGINKVLQPENLLSSIQKVIDEHDKVFINARIPKDAFKAAILLQEAGFYFIETTLSPHTKLIQNSILKRFIEVPIAFIPRKYQDRALAVRTIDKSDLQVKQQIQAIAQNSFVDDRFHIDPNCPDVIANQRFTYWIEDLYQDPATVFYVLNYDGESSGFLCRKEEHLILAGFSKAHRNRGFGDFLWLSVMADMLNRGLKRAHTLISTNNVPVLNLYARLGYQFKFPEITFHYWGDNDHK